MNTRDKFKYFYEFMLNDNKNQILIKIMAIIK